VRGELLFRLNRFDEAHAEFERAAALARNARERDFLLKRAHDCESQVASAPKPQ
jgi:predicted RNA polymerase sigma factor